MHCAVIAMSRTAEPFMRVRLIGQPTQRLCDTPSQGAPLSVSIITRHSDQCNQ